MNKHYWIANLLVLSLLFDSQALANSRFYRYRDTNNQIVITSILPPEIAKEGYQIVNMWGDVIDTIKPQLTEDELAKQSVVDSTQVDKKQLLLASFHSEEEIIQAREANLAAIKLLEESTCNTLTLLRQQLAQAKLAAQAATQEQAEPLSATIVDTERQIKEQQAYLESKTLERQAIIDQYQELLNDFQALKSQH